MKIDFMNFIHKQLVEKLDISGEEFFLNYTFASEKFLF